MAQPGSQDPRNDGRGIENAYKVDPRVPRRAPALIPLASFGQRTTLISCRYEPAILRKVTRDTVALADDDETTDSWRESCRCRGGKKSRGGSTRRDGDAAVNGTGNNDYVICTLKLSRRSAEERRIASLRNIARYFPARNDRLSLFLFPS